MASPGIAPPVAFGLLEYLGGRLGVSGLRYEREPVPITDGWETYVYRFQLQDRSGLACPLGRPLIFRGYACAHGLPRLRREFAAQEYLHRLGYPVARPVLLEESCVPFGGPFMLMEALPGRPLVELLLHRPWRIWGGPAQMADVHARLHRLTTDGFPASPEPFLGRRLAEMEGLIDEYRLRGLRPGLDWLRSHRPAEPRRPSIIHLDFHPLNLMFDQDRCSGVVDWCECDVGDRHADIAATLVLFWSAPVEIPTYLQRLIAWPGRSMLRRRYLRAYRRHLSLNRRTLAYYVAWAALRRLCGWGRWLRAGPCSTGSKPSVLRYLSPESVGVVGQCFHQWSGVPVSLAYGD